MSKRKPKPTPRNGHVAAMRRKSAGAHGKTKKAQRQADRMSLKRSIRDIQKIGDATAFLSAPCA